MRKASGLTLIETFFERLPQMLIQIYAFLFELSFIYGINTISELFDSATQFQVSNEKQPESYNSTFDPIFSETNGNFLLNKNNIWPLISMMLSVMASSYALYSHFRESRKSFYLDEKMHHENNLDNVYYSELSLAIKFGLFFSELLNILTRTILMTVYFQILLNLPIHLALKCLLGVLFLVKPVIFVLWTADYYIKKIDSRTK